MDRMQALARLYFNQNAILNDKVQAQSVVQNVTSIRDGKDLLADDMKISTEQLKKQTAFVD